jgi:multimeric flavodoxin WrbA
MARIVVLIENMFEDSEHKKPAASFKKAKHELVRRYDLDFKGCVRCFACKIINDRLPLLVAVPYVQALSLGSPSYS